MGMPQSDRKQIGMWLQDECERGYIRVRVKQRLKQMKQYGL
jgi:hypothetical protein